MSQNDGKFQSKGKKFGGGGKGPRKPGGGGFGKKFEGDRGGSRDGAKRFSKPGESRGGFGARDSKPRFDSRDSGGDKPYKKREWSSDRPQRSTSDRPDRAGGGDRSYRKTFGDRPERAAGGDRPYKKPFRDRAEGGAGGGDRPYKKPYRDRDAGASGGGDRPYKKPYERREGGSDRPYQKREWNNDRASAGRDRAEGGERPARSFDRPERSGGDRPYKKPYERREGGSFERREGGNFDRGAGGGTSFGHRKGARDFDKRPSRARDFQLEEDEVAAIEPFRASPETKARLKSDRPGYGSPSSAFLYGVHAVKAALTNPKRLHQRLLVTGSGYESIKEAFEEAQAEGLKLPHPTYVENVDIERLLPRDAVHQGLLLDTQPLEDPDLADFLLTMPANAKILMLDQVTDPHNVGAILRSAAAFGASGVIVQKLHAPDITGTLAKTASGAVEHVPVLREVNLSRALEQLKESGFFCIGLAEEGKETISELSTSGKVCLVLGAEGDGLRRLVAENCDVLAKLPTSGPISSLNVSNAAAVALYELIRAA
ncbi:MAG TPA: 23S rRNA (guanosine(2251)-2'-O)-methyltransferase RlmB [Patescibacteria group bacterium]|nr:23S rRNA (guanosine(2251)-2'-O)-methyltransferase RlmB [Patescibacteria group bacterium]